MVGAGAQPERRTGSSFRVNRSLLDTWLSEWRGTRFDIITLTDVATAREVGAAWRKRGGSGGIQNSLEIFEAQAWALCDYFWHVKGTRNRKALLKYMKAELSGRSGAKAFTRAFFGSGRPGWI